VSPLIVPPGLGHTFSPVNSNCHPVGLLDVDFLDGWIRDLFQGGSATDLLIVLLSNVLLTQHGQCCILGYHGAFLNASGAPQTYVVAGVDSALGLDVEVMSHEIAEWMNNPLVGLLNGNGNAVPPWGSIGQTIGCQSNLEVGDPLSSPNFL